MEAWTNVADAGDVVALVKDLRPLFGPKVACYLVDNGSHAHAVQPYLTAAETGAAIAVGLACQADGNDRRRCCSNPDPRRQGGRRFLLTGVVSRYHHEPSWNREELARTCGAWSNYLPATWVMSMCR